MIIMMMKMVKMKAKMIILMMKMVKMKAKMKTIL